MDESKKGAEGESKKGGEVKPAKDEKAELTAWETVGDTVSDTLDALKARLRAEGWEHECVYAGYCNARNRNAGRSAADGDGIMECHATHECDYQFEPEKGE